jgi:CDP-L-myo-inositol myo-inositolphosphotransferase
MNVTVAASQFAIPFDRGVPDFDRLEVILFPSPEAAARNIAGLPAAARAVRERAATGAACCAIAVPGGWRPADTVSAELDRLAGTMAYACVDADLLVGRGTGRVMVHTELLPVDAARRIVAATGKPGDGIVSRHINRPVSQAFSGLLLRWPGIRPIHATWATAALAIGMLFSLLLGGAAGLVAGAVLFQAASIADGVDGEIARATFRTSAQGAKLDSLVDAATNIGFVGGVAVNLYRAGEVTAALAGGAAGLLLAAGLALIGRAARASKRPFTFNGVKERVGAGKSRVMTWLTWLTMRDFFALAAALLVIAGFAPFTMFAFAVVTTGWFAVVVAVMGRQAG